MEKPQSEIKTSADTPETREQAASGEKDAKKPGWVARLVQKCIRFYEYMTGGIWRDTRRTFRVNCLKTISLSLRSFFNSELQLRAAALTYQTILAVVPAIALLFAICRGFGFQNLLQSQLFIYFPAQKEALETVFSFLDSYLLHASEGIFLGIGIVFLLWTLISLISNVEASFNKIWGVPRGRTIWRQITDYTAIFLILPVLMICSSGITVFMSSTLQSALPYDFVSPLLSFLLDFSSLVLVWLFFTGTYLLIPNTKVKFKNAFLAGVLAGTGFMIVEWLFVTGQIYVTRYNALYGSFAFLPLLLIWIDLVWLITLSGAVLCYSSQNIYQFSFSDEVINISRNYEWRITLSVLAVADTRFERGETPLTELQISQTYNIPMSLVTSATNLLVNCKLLQRVVISGKTGEYGIAPAIDPRRLTMEDVSVMVGRHGNNNFLPDFDKLFVNLNAVLARIGNATSMEAEKIPLTAINIDDVLPAAAEDTERRD